MTSLPSWLTPERFDVLVALLTEVHEEGIAKGRELERRYLSDRISTLFDGPTDFMDRMPEPPESEAITPARISIFDTGRFDEDDLIDVLQLEARTTKLLKENGIHRIGQLQRTPDEYLTDMDGFGPVSLTRLKTQLLTYGVQRGPFRPIERLKLSDDLQLRVQKLDIRVIPYLERMLQEDALNRHFTPEERSEMARAIQTYYGSLPTR